MAQKRAKEYLIRVCEPKARGMQFFISVIFQRRWKDLDSSKVSFRGSARPRAQYLYFHYCMTMLRRSWNQTKPMNVLRDELGKLFWSTPGWFMPKRMLLAFVEDMGQEYARLLHGAGDEVDEVEVVETALAAANQQITLTLGGKAGLSQGDGNDDSDDGSDDDGQDYSDND